jgi:hypothetical protein
MASLIPSGSASGTGSMTLAAPVTNSNQTITLPDSTGIVALTSGLPASGQLVKAWVTYNGNTQTILASYNVSSVTYRDAGRYTVNFTTAMTDGNYSVVGMVSNDSTGAAYIGAIQDYTNAAPSTTACPVMTGYAFPNAGMISNASYRATNYAYFAFFR